MATRGSVRMRSYRVWHGDESWCASPWTRSTCQNNRQAAIRSLLKCICSSQVQRTLLNTHCCTGTAASPGRALTSSSAAAASARRAASAAARAARSSATCAARPARKAAFAAAALSWRACRAASRAASLRLARAAPIQADEACGGGCYHGAVHGLCSSAQGRQQQSPGSRPMDCLQISACPLVCIQAGSMRPCGPSPTCGRQRCSAVLGKTPRTENCAL